MSSTCGKCGSHSFKISQNSPTGSRYKFNFVQCSSCGVPIGALDFFNTGAQLEDQKREIDALSQRLSSIEGLLQQVVHVLKRK